MTSVSDIDELLATTKRLAAAPSWARDEKGTVSRLVAPVLVQGVIG